MYRQRCEQLMKEMGENTIGLWLSSPHQKRNSDSEYLYRQSSDLLYLTGCPSPETALLLIPSAETEKIILFVQPRDVKKEIWNGRRLGAERAKEHYQVDAAYSIEELPKKMHDYLNGCKQLYFRLGAESSDDAKVIGWLQKARIHRRKGKNTPSDILDPDALLHEMRLFKSEEEIELMRRAAQITAAGHRYAMQVVKPKMQEYQLESAIYHQFRKAGANGMSYNPIVGGGENATILHYNENDAELNDGDLVLIDAGAEYKHYAGDITRTFPVNGRFSERQRLVYQIVLEAEEAGLAACRPGNRFDDVHKAAIHRITQGLIELGVLTGELESLLESDAYKPYYMHKTSHWLGLDVHDPGCYYEEDGSSRILEPGMVLTVEPGLYFNSDYHDEATARPFHGIGIRIEDDILITKDGYENLTKDAPKTIEEIEALAGSLELA